MLQFVAEALVRASQLALIAIGMTAVFGLLRFANIAHVELAVIGAFAALWLTSSTPLGFAAAAVLSMVITGLLAIALHHLVFAQLLRRSAAIAMIGSLALSLIMRNGLQSIVGSRPYRYDLPLQRAIEFGPVRITPTQVWIIAVTVAALLLFTLLLNRTRLGRAMRAVAANEGLAQASGVNTLVTTNAVWFISGALAALGGMLLALEVQVSVDMGFNLLLLVFAAVILGGIGSPMGAVAAAVLIAMVERAALRVDFGSLVGGAPAYLPVSYGPAVGFLALVLVLLYRPSGLFGSRGRNA